MLYDRGVGAQMCTARMGSLSADTDEHCMIALDDLKIFLEQFTGDAGGQTPLQAQWTARAGPGGSETPGHQGQRQPASPGRNRRLRLETTGRSIITIRSQATRHEIISFHSIPSPASARSTGPYGEAHGSAFLLRLATEKLCKHLNANGQSLHEQLAFLVQQGLDPPE
jgi:hypothetical protein